MDACPRYRVNYFAIDVRYFVADGTGKTKKLCQLPIRASMQVTSARAVSDVLKDFEIEKKQVVCAVTMHRT